MLDVDHFKRINDSEGHAAGDFVLQQVTATAREALGAMDRLGRVGGEEFAAMLPEPDAAGAAHSAERLRAAIEAREFRFGDVAIRVTASLGVASLGGGDTGAGTLLARADAALYRAKHSGRNRVAAGVTG